MMVDDRSWFFKITGNRELARVENPIFSLSWRVFVFTNPP